MQYDHDPIGYSGIDISFEGIEVEVVREAFREHSDYLRSLGNDSSISAYQQWVAEWSGAGEAYRGPDDSQVVDKLQYFLETTEEKVDVILDEGQPDRYKLAGRRYKLGQRAADLLQDIELQKSMDTERSDEPLEE